jgi:hypothetical protein
MSAAIINHFKMPSKTINFSLGGMGCRCAPPCELLCTIRWDAASARSYGQPFCSCRTVPGCLATGRAVVRNFSSIEQIPVAHSDWHTGAAVPSPAEQCASWLVLPSVLGMFCGALLSYRAELGRQ